jgi:ATP-dependent HslUV protease, peptidase subunit HslV
MSTLTVVKKDGWVAIAADSLTTYGNSKETAQYVLNHSKILQVGDTYIAIAGPASASAATYDYFHNHALGARFDSVEAIFRTWLSLHDSLKTRYFLNANREEGNFESTCLDALIANAHGIFGIDGHRTAQEYSQFYATGGGARFALGAMYGVYNDSSKSAEEIARFGVEAAAEFHNATGLPVLSYAVKLIEG